MDFVIEAVVENLDIKRRALRELESAVDAGAIIASNTSSLSVDDMAAVLRHPERFVGMHFFNPVNRMPLVEIVSGAATSPETVATAVAVLIITIGAVAGGVIPFGFFPEVEGDAVTASARLPFGAPVDRRRAVRGELQAAWDLAM